MDCHKGKSGIDPSDQMSSYATTLREGFKWCKKLAMESILGISLVNALVVIKLRHIQIRHFRERDF